MRDRYLAIEPIGQGGFGRTFKAIDEDKPAKPFCVIKQFLPQMEGTAASKAAELFTQEASALEQLDNPSIPKLLAYFITPDHRLYLVQEFIDGQNLKGELETNGVFSSLQIRELLLTLLPVLDYVHNLGFIHRDIKPENIMRRTSDRRLFLVDFGAAKVKVAERSQLQGTTIGTPEFMAPEQAWGRAFAASDLYSLGVTCIHLLTGVSPFSLVDDNSGEWNWRKYLSQQIDPELATVLDKLIQHKPSDRYAAATEVIADLQAKIATQNSEPKLVAPSQNSLPIPEFTQPIAQMPVVTQTEREWVCTHTFEWHSKPINTIAMFPDGRYLVSGDDGGTVAIWNLAIPQNPIATYRANDSVWAVAASPNLSQLASGDKNRKVQIGRKESIINSRKELHGDFSTLDSHSGFVYTVEFSPDGTILASGGADRRIRLWNTESGKIIYTLDGHQDAVTAVKFMPNGKILISAGADRTLRFWDLESKQLLKTIDAHAQKIHALALGRDGKTIVSGSSDRTVLVRQLGTASQHSLQGHQDAVLAVAISADDKTIASGSIDGTVCLWDATTQQLISSFSAHQSAVKAIVFQPTGTNFISASWDRTIKVWQST